MNSEHALLFSGSSHSALAEQIAHSAQIPLGKMITEQFPDGEISVELLESVRGKQVFVVQSIAHQPNQYLMELLIIVDALKRSSAKEVVAVVPYFGYCRQDRKDKPRVPITAKLVANLMVRSGISRLATMDLHAEQVQGFFDIPVDHLYARRLLVQAIMEQGIKPETVVAPDIGSIKIARAFAHELGVDFAVIDKKRQDASAEVGVLSLIGDVKGKDVLLADDVCSTGHTLWSAAKACREKGAKRIIAAVTHGLFAGPALNLIEQSPIDILYCADTIDLKEAARKLPKLRCVPVAGLIGRALTCMLSNKSITSLFI